MVALRHSVTERSSPSKSRHTIRLGAASIRILRALRQRQIERRLVVRLDYYDLGLVFCAPPGTPPVRRNAIRAFKRRAVGRCAESRLAPLRRQRYAPG